MSTYKRGTTVTHYCSFTTLDGQEPLLITGAKLTIRHVDETLTLVTDVFEAPLILVAENVYYYKWTIPAGAYLGHYNSECEGFLDGIYSEANETIKVEA